MRRFYLWTAVLLTAFLACGCQSARNYNDGIYNVSREGRSYAVDAERGTVTCDGIVYQYTMSGGRERGELHVTYPDGSTYFWRESASMAAGGSSPDYDPDAHGYVRGEVLWDVLAKKTATPAQSGGVLLSILLAAVGAGLVFQPYAMWMLSHGWRFKDAEPSGLALHVNRVLGVVVIAAAFCFFLAQFNFL